MFFDKKSQTILYFDVKKLLAALAVEKLRDELKEDLFLESSQLETVLAENMKSTKQLIKVES